MTLEVLRYSAFTDTPDGGNPAGVVPDAGDLDEAGMLAIAARLGYSETVFLRARGGGGEYDARYFSPQAEVPFCGHATIAAAVALADRGVAGTLRFHTRAGEVQVETSAVNSRATATLTSVQPHLEPATDALVDAALAALHWSREDLDPALPPRIGYGGARHLVLAVRTRERLARLDYDFEAARRLSAEHDLTTFALLWRESSHVFHARNPFPIGGVIEDPATGAAAAALGAYLREIGAVSPPARVTAHQGVDMGRPSLLHVDIGESGGIRVSGSAVPIA
ncbi:PhzF family phenazine biosynthesis protein [Cognatilysobacter bugurensis]|uniref:Oxidoreductase n=1 Tax=Cognatilysobacter bugurensis TaxID=543356 RepID=A0A918W8F5_9GAMM|nr:PhzF family phenazine biosynthesis protein [Lysobacter bugurensis]GHA80561.1 oxidoreductase [Lysobacter bugurensis]